MTTIKYPTQLYYLNKPLDEWKDLTIRKRFITLKGNSF